MYSGLYVSAAVHTDNTKVFAWLAVICVSFTYLNSLTCIKGHPSVLIAPLGVKVQDICIYRENTLRNKGYKRVLPEGLRFYPESFAPEEPSFEGTVPKGIVTSGLESPLLIHFTCVLP